MTDPERLIGGSRGRIAAELLAAGRLEEPSPELVQRFARSAALGLGAVAVAPHVVRAAAELASGQATALGGSASSAMGASSAAAGQLAASASPAAAAAGGTAAAVGGASGAATGVAGSSAAGAVLVKWVGVGVVSLGAAVGAPEVLQVVQRERAAEPAGPAVAAARVATRGASAAAPPATAPQAAPSPLELRPRAPASAALPARRAPESARAVEPPRAPALLPLAPGAPRPASTAPRSHSLPAPSLRAPAPAQAAATPSPRTLEPSALGAELAHIDRARAALARGDGRRALDELSSYERVHPKRQLQLEVTLLRMEAHLAAGDHARARELATRILGGPVPAPHAARAREVLAAEPPAR